MHHQYFTYKTWIISKFETAQSFKFVPMTPTLNLSQQLDLSQTVSVTQSSFLGIFIWKQIHDKIPVFLPKIKSPKLL